MSRLVISMVIGIIAGVIDIIPMILQKLDKRAIYSAFFQYFFVAIIILNINLPDIPWWLQGGIISFCLAIPVMIIVSVNDKKAIIAIASMSVIIGTLISIAGYFVFG